MLERDRPLRVVVVTAYPPSTGANNEYGFHFVRHLRQKPEIGAVYVLRDAPTSAERAAIWEDDGAEAAPLEVIPCWRLESWGNAPRILAAVRRIKPDLVFFNLDFPAFGSGKIAATLGLLTPMLARAMGYPTAALLHSVIEVVDLRSTGSANNALTAAAVRTFGTVVTRAILAIDFVALTMPKYVEILAAKYRARNVLLAPHGTFERTPPPSLDPPPGPTRLFTFGKFGTYKTVEPLIEAYRLLRAERGEDLEVVIAGVDSPNAPGYLDGVRARYADTPGLRFTGYVPEADVPRLFSEATVVVLPYTNTTGSSSVLHMAGQQGRPAVFPDIGDFTELIADQGYGGETFEPGDPRSLADAIGRLLDSPERRRELGLRNWQAAVGLPLADVVEWYLFHFAAILKPHATVRERVGAAARRLRRRAAAQRA